MDIDSAIKRYLREPEVARWLFSTEDIRTITAEALDSSFVYAIGWGICPPGTARAMNIEDMLIVTGQVGTFVLGFVWGLSQPHVFADTPLMLNKVPLSRRFAVDFSSREALEFMEFVCFDDGKVVVMFRQFLHTYDLSLPVVACARLHGSSKLEHTLGPVIMRADLFEAACCPACGQVGKQCHCSFDSYAPNTMVRKSTHTWNQFSGAFMRKARVGTIKLRMSAYLPNIGEMRIMDDEIPVVNVLQMGNTEYMRLLKRKAVHGLGVNVIMPRADALVMAKAVEHDFIDLHNSYVTRKRVRDNQVNEQDPASILPSQVTQEKPATLDLAPAQNMFVPNPATKNVSNSDSLESVDDVLSIFPSFFSTATSPHHPSTAAMNEMFPVKGPYSPPSPAPTSIPQPPPPVPDVTDILDKGPFSRTEPNTTAELLLNSDFVKSSEKPTAQSRTPEDIMNDIELILSPPGSQAEVDAGDLNAEDSLQLLSHALGTAAGTGSGGETFTGQTMNSRTGGNGHWVQTSGEAVLAETPLMEAMKTMSTATTTTIAMTSKTKTPERLKTTTAKRSKRRVETGSGGGVRPGDSGVDNEKKHGCSQCSSRFKMRGDLLRHVKIVHEGKKMYTCERCGKSFGHSGHLNRHISSVHLQQRRFKCQFCGFQFFQASHLQSHIGHIHGAKKAFTCKECGHRASSQGGLKIHMEQVHIEDDRLVKCPMNGCRERFGFENELTVHLLSAHQGGDGVMQPEAALAPLLR